MNHNDNFNHILRNTFLLLGFIVVGIFLTLTGVKQRARGAASQGSGTLSFTPTVIGNYTIPVRITGSDANTGQVVASQVLTFTVAAANPITCDYFYATPSKIYWPQQAMLKWSCPGSTSCDIDNGVGPVPAPKDTSSTFVSPQVTTLYTLTCDNGVLQAQVSTIVTEINSGIKEVLP